MESIEFPEVEEVFKEKSSIKKYVKYLTFFGPGAIIASVTIGQGQLILGPQIGAWAKHRLLWLMTINIGSYIIAYLSTKYTLITGLNMMDIFSTKLRGLLNWIFIAIMIIFIPMFAATIVTSLGQSLAWIFGFGHYLVWGISFALLAALFAIAGRYKLLEYTQLIFVIVLAAGAIFSVAVIKNIDVLGVITHFFTIGDFPRYPSWVESTGEATKPIPLLILGYVGTITIPIITIVSYAGWVKIKRWGIFRGQENPERFSRRLFAIFRESGRVEYLPTEKSEVEKAKVFAKPLLIDLSIAFIFVSVASAAYMIAGAYLLGPRHELPTDIDLLKKQAVIFSNISPWLKPLYQLSIFFALFGTIYGGFEAASRMVYETSKNLIKSISNMSYQKFMRFFLIYILIFGLPLAILMYYGLSVIIILSITLLFTGVVGVIIYGLGVVYVIQTTLPEEYRLDVISMMVAIIAIIFLIIPFFSFFA